MDKKVLKFYETPAQEIIETELEGFLCTSDPEPSTNAEGVDEDPLGD
jgi:hypothetical protein